MRFSSLILSAFFAACFLACDCHGQAALDLALDLTTDPQPRNISIQLSRHAEQIADILGIKPLLERSLSLRSGRQPGTPMS
jgi:hypothetical protein